MRNKRASIDADLKIIACDGRTATGRGKSSTVVKGEDSAHR